ncbi:MAG: hypothetical protein AMS27_12760 [Bacteroides sp. SM23_62_1]|nr:MAG: hypothetical protein AMS27_12760 [Bacteroides sp. SM23_62_1]
MNQRFKIPQQGSSFKNENEAIEFHSEVIIFLVKKPGFFNNSEEMNVPVRKPGFIPAMEG